MLRSVIRSTYFKDAQVQHERKNKEGKRFQCLLHVWSKGCICKVNDSRYLWHGDSCRMLARSIGLTFPLDACSIISSVHLMDSGQQTGGATVTNDWLTKILWENSYQRKFPYPERCREIHELPSGVDLAIWSLQSEQKVWCWYWQIHGVECWTVEEVDAHHKGQLSGHQHKIPPIIYGMETLK